MYIDNFRTITSNNPIFNTLAVERDLNNTVSVQILGIRGLLLKSTVNAFKNSDLDHFYAKVVMQGQKALVACNV